MRKGFTLIELLVVVAILIVLVGIGIGAYPRIKAKQMQSICTVNQEEILSGIERYKEITGKLPQTQAEFEQVLLDTHYFEKVPENPYWTDNANHPEKGWKWDAADFSVEPLHPGSR